MRVLYLTNIPSPYRVDFFNELGKTCELTVLFERERAADRNRNWISDKAINFKAVFLKGIKVRSDSAICTSVIKWLDKKKFDIIVVGGYSTPTGMLSILTLHLKKIPFILNSDGGIIKKDKRFTKYVKKFFISKADSWLSTGVETNKYLLHYGAKENNIFVYPFTSVRKKDLINHPNNQKEKVKIRKELGLKGDRIVISVGQFIERKGFESLISIWSEIPKDTQLIIIGGGPEKESYIKQINNKNLKNISIEGFKPKEELIKYYRCADLFIMPTQEDIWGLVINEALANGLPIISSNKCVAALELLREDQIYSINSEQELINIINRFIDSEKTDFFSEVGLKKINNYTIESMAERHNSIFKQLQNN